MEWYMILFLSYDQYTDFWLRILLEHKGLADVRELPF